MTSWLSDDFQSISKTYLQNNDDGTSTIYLIANYRI